MEEESGDPVVTRDLIDHLVGERLLTIRSDSSDLGRGQVDIAHEVLIKRWVKLQEWLTSDISERQLREDFQRDAETYAQRGKRLPSSATQLDYLSWLERKGQQPTLTQAQQAFTRAMRSEVRLRRRIRIAVVVGSLVITVGMIGLATWALLEKSQVDMALKEVEETLATELVRSIGRKLHVVEPGEVDALWTLAALKDKERVRELFVERLVENFERAQRLERRTEIALHATVGLNSTRRKMALEMFADRFQHETDGDIRLACALGIASLRSEDSVVAGACATLIVNRFKGEDDTVTQAELRSSLLELSPKIRALDAAELIVQVMPKTTTNADGLCQLAEELKAMLDKMPSEQMPNVAALAAAQIIEGLRHAKNTSDLRTSASRLGDCLMAMAEKLTPNQAQPIAEQIVRAMQESTTNTLCIGGLAQGLKAVAGRLHGNQAQLIAEQIIQAMQKPGSFNFSIEKGMKALLANSLTQDQVQQLVESIVKAQQLPMATLSSRVGQGYCLELLAEKLTPDRAYHVAEVIVRAMQKVGMTEELSALRNALKSVGKRLTIDRAGQVAELLIQALRNPETGSAQRPFLLEGLQAVDGKLSADQADKAAGLIVQAMKAQAMNEYPNSFKILALADVLTAVMKNQNPEYASKKYREAVGLIIQAMKKAPGSGYWDGPVKGLNEMADKVAPQHAQPIAEQIIQAMHEPTISTNTLGHLAECLKAVLRDKLTPDHALKVGDLIIEAMRKEVTKNPVHVNPLAVASLASGMKALADKLTPDQAGQAAELIVQAIKNPGGVVNDELRALVEGLRGLAERLKAEQTELILAQIIQGMMETKNVAFLSYLSEGMQAVAEKLGQAQAPLIVVWIVKAMKQPAILEAQLAMAEGLQVVAGKLEPDKALDAAWLIVEAMEVPTMSKSARGILGIGLSVVADKLEAVQRPRVATRAADLIAQTMESTEDSYSMRYLAKGLKAVGGELSADQAQQAAERIVAAIQKPGLYDARPALRDAFVAVGNRLTMKQAPRVAELIVHGLRNPATGSELRGMLLEGLQIVAGKLTLDQGQLIAEQVVHAMRESNANPLCLGALAKGLIVVADQVTLSERASKPAAQAAEIIIKAMRKTTVNSVLNAQAEGLKAVVDKMSREQKFVITINLVELMATDSRDELIKTLDFYKARLSVTEIIRILKSPLCVGKARRALLQQLGLQPEINQRFATLWDMVDWIEANRPDLAAELLTPPIRPANLVP